MTIAYGSQWKNFFYNFWKNHPSRGKIMRKIDYAHKIFSKFACFRVNTQIFSKNQSFSENVYFKNNLFFSSFSVKIGIPSFFHIGNTRVLSDFESDPDSGYFSFQWRNFSGRVWMHQIWWKLVTHRFLGLNHMATSEFEFDAILTLIQGHFDLGKQSFKHYINFKKCEYNSIFGSQWVIFTR